MLPAGGAGYSLDKLKLRLQPKLTYYSAGALPSRLERSAESLRSGWNPSKARPRADARRIVGELHDFSGRDLELEDLPVSDAVGLEYEEATVSREFSPIDR